MPVRLSLVQFDSLAFSLCVTAQVQQNMKSVTYCAHVCCVKGERAPAGQHHRHIRGARGQCVCGGVVSSGPLAVRLPQL